MTTSHLGHGFVAIICAAGAGVHTALVPSHADEPALAIAFAGSAAALTCTALLLRLPRHDDWAPTAAAALLGAIATAYLMATTTGVPWLMPGPQKTDPRGVITTAAEVLGAVTAMLLTTRREPSHESKPLERVGIDPG